MTFDSTLQIRSKDTMAQGVVALTLAHRRGRRLPDWAPGAHIDLVLPNGITRQYSLCGDRWDAHAYRVAVLREADGRGGSAYVHDHLRVGDLVGVGGPRNNFPMVPAPTYLFVAGGIGITPMLPMIAQADLMGVGWTLLYFGRSRSTMAFLDELAAVYGERVVVVASDEGAALDLSSRMAAAATASAKVYVCGPQRLLDAVEIECATWPTGRLRTERFVPREQAAPALNDSFEVELARTGITVTVPPRISVLDAVVSAGVNVLASCREGTCGTCETTVLAGAPDHRDSILDDIEQAAADCMYPCVSRSCTDRLVLDL